VLDTARCLGLVAVARRWLTIRQNVATAFGLASKKSSKNPQAFSGGG
jgi:hypothetical protein